MQNLIHFGKFCQAAVFMPTTFRGCDNAPSAQSTFTGQNMKKFSTAALVLALASVFGSAGAAEWEVKNPSCVFLADAPDQHTVVRGDTLWDISGKFLQNPWCWPQVWGLNQDQIRDPHWIYPGQIIYFDRVAGRLSLVPPTGHTGLRTVHLSPRVRSEGVDRHAVPTIPANLIEPFLAHPLVLAENELQDAPRIMATREGRVLLGKNDKAYVRGELNQERGFQVFRPGTPLKDPVTQEVLGHEATYLGTVKLERAATATDEAHTFTVTSTKQEMRVGDRLLPIPPTPILNYAPHAPAQAVDARIMSVYGGVSQAGQNQIVTVNRGRKDGINPGTVLELYRFGNVVIDPTSQSTSSFGGKERVKLPDTKYGNLLVFHVFNNISYGLVMQVTDSVKIGDIAKSPD